VKQENKGASIRKRPSHLWFYFRPTVTPAARRLRFRRGSGKTKSHALETCGKANMALKTRG